MGGLLHSGCSCTYLQSFKKFLYVDEKLPESSPRDASLALIRTRARPGTLSHLCCCRGSLPVVWFLIWRTSIHLGSKARVFKLNIQTYLSSLYICRRPCAKAIQLTDQSLAPHISHIVRGNSLYKLSSVDVEEIWDHSPHVQSTASNDT